MTLSTFDGATIDVSQATYGELTVDGAADMYVISGVALVDKALLIGVPHVITSVTYQAIPPAPTSGPRKGEKVRGFVSIEATVADEPTLARAIQRHQMPGIAKNDQCPFDPNERIVYNDGGTGIRRSLTAMFDRIGLIKVGGDTDPEKDPNGRRFDTAWDEWDSAGDQLRFMSEEIGSVPHITKNPTGGPLLISCRRGLRVSQYDVEGLGEAETYYFS